MTRNAPDLWKWCRFRIGSSCNAHEVTSRASVQPSDHCATPFLRRQMAKRPLLFAFSFFVLGLVSFITQASEAAQTGLDLPQPNACYPVGVKTLSLTDTSRSRDLVVTFWYPATGGTFPLAPYM